MYRLYVLEAPIWDINGLIIIQQAIIVSSDLHIPIAIFMFVYLGSFIKDSQPLEL